ncbi:MAG: LacI family DNA-binding transcriptional regulator [Bacteroidales bacterium]|nr:LacI family DNA-binding transcriptional regulator [Bacteroidales bacterium]
MKKVTIKDVAREAGVSIALVSRVLNAPLKENGLPDCSVRDVTARRILNTVRYLGYHPNKAAVSLRKRLRRRLGVILPDISNPFFADIARYLGEIARAHDYIVLLGNSDEDPAKLSELAGAFLEDGVDGIVLTPGCACEEAVQGIVDQGLPVILTIRDIPSVRDAGKVLTNDALGTRLAIDHLRSAGFERIDMLSTTLRYANIEQRENLYLERMQQEGLPAHVLHLDKDNREESMKFILEDALRRGVRALFAPNASLPLLCLQECRRSGVRIPQDIALMGHDGGELYRLTEPTITQIRYERRAIAEEAFSLFLEMLEDRTRIPEPRRLDPVLIPGKSTQSGN